MTSELTSETAEREFNHCPIHLPVFSQAIKESQEIALLIWWVACFRAAYSIDVNFKCVKQGIMS